jgi:hypothetical protein
MSVFSIFDKNFSWNGPSVKYARRGVKEKKYRWLRGLKVLVCRKNPGPGGKVRGRGFYRNDRYWSDEVME